MLNGWVTTTGCGWLVACQKLRPVQVISWILVLAAIIFIVCFVIFAEIMIIESYFFAEERHIISYCMQSALALEVN
jgi:hypothetical protein